MIRAILIDADEIALNYLENKLLEFCPQVKVIGKTSYCYNIEDLVEENNPNLIFIDINSPDFYVFGLLNRLSIRSIEFIVISNVKEFAYEALKFSATGFILKPIMPDDLILAVRQANKKIQFRKASERDRVILNKIDKKLSCDELIGIPTMQGFDFLRIDAIIRCEGLQKCTQVVTLERSNIVSSYNLGEFRKLLEPFGFFSPHKSHLINLNRIKKYLKEGSVIMTDGSRVPVSRRRKSEFLNFVLHV